MNQNGGIHKGGFAVLCHRNGGSESPGILSRPNRKNLENPKESPRNLYFKANRISVIAVIVRFRISFQIILSLHLRLFTWIAGKQVHLTVISQ